MNEICPLYIREYIKTNMMHKIGHCHSIRGKQVKYALVLFQQKFIVPPFIMQYMDMVTNWMVTIHFSTSHRKQPMSFISAI